MNTEKFKRGEIIINQGELGDRLFVLLKGAVRVYTHGQQGEEIVLARLEKGAFFGEQSLLPGKPVRRNASVRALTDVVCLTLSHDAFQRHLKSSPTLRQLLEKQGEAQLLSNVRKQLQDSSDDIHLLQSFHRNVQRFRRRQVFFRQGDSPDHVYFLARGSVVVRFHDENLKLESESRVNPGQFFGELGLLKNAPRKGTAVALSDAHVCVIDGGSFREMYEKNRWLKGFIDAVLGVYHVPTHGLITQYEGRFVQQPAIQTTIQKPNEETIIASRVIHADIVAIHYSDTSQAGTKVFQDRPDHRREIMIAEDHLVGVISIGRWDDLSEISKHVYGKTIMSKAHLDRFSSCGELIPSTQRSIDQEDALCTCMQVKGRVIQDLISAGAHSIDAIAKKSGAGSVCGGCRPHILQMLGGEAWIYAKLIGLEEHNESIRGFRLEPMNHIIRNYDAGRHLVIEGHIDNNWVSRCYTLTSTDADPYYEITVKRESLGLFSRWLFNHCRVGEIFRITAPQGSLGFSPEARHPAVCLMAGIGITPAISFAKKLISTGAKRRLYVDYSARSVELAFRDELTGWPKNHLNISARIRRTDVDGRMTVSDLKSIVSQYPEADFYVCGPLAYEEAVTEMLKQLEVPADRVHVETFIHAGGPDH